MSLLFLLMHCFIIQLFVQTKTKKEKSQTPVYNAYDIYQIAVCDSHPVRYSRVHGHSQFTLLLNHQVHVVVLQDGDHLYLHGTLKRMRSKVRDTSGRVQLVNIS